MNKILSYIISLVVFAALIFLVDAWLVNLIIDAFPASAKDWLTLIRIATWIVVLWATFGVAAFISALVGMIVSGFLQWRSNKRKLDHMMDRKPRSPWEERLEEKWRHQSRKI